MLALPPCLKALGHDGNSWACGHQMDQCPGAEDRPHRAASAGAPGVQLHPGSGVGMARARWAPTHDCQPPGWAVRTQDFISWASRQTCPHGETTCRVAGHAGPARQGEAECRAPLQGAARNPKGFWVTERQGQSEEPGLGPPAGLTHLPLGGGGSRRPVPGWGSPPHS